MLPPLCRESQFGEVSRAVELGERLLVLSGPVSSGKTVTIKAFLQSLPSDVLRAHVLCETGDTISDVLTETVRQVIGQEVRRRSVSKVSKLVQAIGGSDVRTVVVFDSFDLLEKVALDLFKKIEAVCDMCVLPCVTFVVATHVSPQHFAMNPLAVYNVVFPGYNRGEIVKIVGTTLGEIEAVRLSGIIDICSPMTCDVRDVIFVVHSIGSAEMTKAELGKRVLDVIDAMRSQRMSRISDLANSAAGLLIAIHIASRTTLTSDLLRFARTRQKKSRKTKMLEEHEYVPLERVFALAKALIYSHLGGFESDFSMRLQLHKLISLGFVEMRGDVFLDPSVRSFASEHEVFALAGQCDVRLDEYLSEK